MKFNPVRCAVLVAVVAITACSKGPEQPAAPKTPEKTFTITGDDQMKFDVTQIEAKPNQTIAVTLKNIGTMPKVSMGHNFVVLAKGQDPAKFVEASQTHLGNDHIAPELKNKVIAHTKLLGPGETDTVVFTTPQVPDTYNFLCSFPGHFAAGMKGTLTVKR